MSDFFAARDITEFLDDSVGGYLNSIEDYAIKMSEENDKEQRIRQLNEIQHLIELCKTVLR